MRPNPFLPQSPAMATLYRWHDLLDENRGDRAALRRAATLEAVALSPAYVGLLKALEKNYGRFAAEERMRLAAVAGLAAHVRDVLRGGGKSSAASALPQQMRGDAHHALPVSPQRFRRILEQEEIPELFTLLRRTLSILKGKAHLRDLAYSVFGWGPEVRRRWAYAYYPATDTKKESTK